MKPEVIGAASLFVMFSIGFVFGWVAEPASVAWKAFNGVGWGALFVGSMVYPNTIGKLLRGFLPGI